MKPASQHPRLKQTLSFQAVTDQSPFAILLVSQVHWYQRPVRQIGGLLGDGLMNCRDTIHLICWYLEGRLSSGVETEIKRHLEACSDCRIVLEAAVNTLDRYFNAGRSELTRDAFRAA
ncbi:MAG TPA: zf-HC2 domain-containing protein [Candidatus Dormibacteraeota bacterium]|nr:zf-HC2 domain-containing protein [Candidatus Dormibacteraeota bacterium]